MSEIPTPLRQLIDAATDTTYPSPKELRMKLDQLRDSPNINAEFYNFMVECPSGPRMQEVFYASPVDKRFKGNEVLLRNNPHSNEVVSLGTSNDVMSFLNENPAAWDALNLGGIAIFDADPVNAERNGKTLFADEKAWELFWYMYNAYRSRYQVDLDFSGRYEDYEFRLPSEHPSQASKLGTVALLRALRPDVHMPGHNFGLGVGPTTYTSHNSSLFNILRQQTLAYVGLQPSAVSDSANQKQLAPGVFGYYGIEVMREDGIEAGLSSVDVSLAVSPNTFNVTDETPYFLSGAQIVPPEQALEVLDGLVQQMDNILTPHGDGTCLKSVEQREFFYSANEPFQRWKKRVQETRTGRKPLTDMMSLSPFYAGISLGMANRLYEMTEGEPHEGAVRSLSAVANLYSEAQFISHKRSKQSQLGALGAALYAVNERDFEAQPTKAQVDIPEYTFPNAFLKHVRGG